MPNLRSWLRWKLLNSYYFYRLSQEMNHFLHRIEADDPIIIYQMGKVGSTTVLRSLQSLRLPNPILHLHTLTDAGQAHGKNAYRSSIKERFPRSKHLIDSLYLRKAIARSGSRRQWKIITLVRDPLSQNISSFFQIIDTLVPNFRHRYQEGSLDFGELREVFLEHYPPNCIFNHWFDTELGPSFDIDVYATPFPKTQGYAIYNSKRARILLMRTESLNQCAREALPQFLGTKQFPLNSHNIGENKQYASLYKNFRNAVVLPSSHVQSIYELRQAKHFYTEAEIAAFKAKYRSR